MVLEGTYATLFFGHACLAKPLPNLSRTPRAAGCPEKRISSVIREPFHQGLKTWKTKTSESVYVVMTTS